MKNFDKLTFTKSLKDYSQSIGFQSVGVSRAQELTEEAKLLERWLALDYQGDMSYLNRNFDLRIDPRKLHPDTKSILSFSHNYFSEDLDSGSNFKISKYAQGQDYHKVMKKKLKLVINWMKNELGDINARAFVDSAPVMEREWAKRSGIGWIGKNSLLLTKGIGSYFFLGEILVDIDLEYDSEVKNYCGTCTKCIDACPTTAIIQPGLIDSKKCISYLTIEYRQSELPETYKDHHQNWIYGCDICQDVCPINARSKQHNEPVYISKDAIRDYTDQQWLNLTEIEFNTIFHDSAVKRAGYHGFMRNIRAVYESKK